MIAETRELLAQALGVLGWPVWAQEPSDVAEVPCVVVGRPSMEIAGQLFTITNPVWTIGRRLGDAEAALELDHMTDTAIELVRSVASVTALSPTIRTIAELSYPAYRIDCVTGQGVC